MAFSNTYRFLLDGVQVAPIIGNEFNIEYKKESGSFYFRKQLTDDIKFFGSEYRTINESGISQKFTVKIQKYNGSTWEDEFDGFFYKTDCSFDNDREILTVKPVADDGWEDLKKVLNNEYNLRDILPETKTVNYKLRPVLQIIVPQGFGIFARKNEKMLNISGLSYWVEDIITIESELELLNDYHFSKSVIGGYWFFYRYLSGKSTFNSVAAEDRPENDISSITRNYPYISKEVVSGSIKTSGIVQDNPSEFGLVKAFWVDIACPEKKGKYYTTYEDPNYYSIPILPEFFSCISYWYIYNNTITQYELDNSLDVRLEDAYTLDGVIQKLLDQNTDILFLPNINYSSFLYDTQDPIAGEVFDLLLTAKSNIVNSFYDEPARKVNIRLSEVFQMLQSAFNVYWHIEKVGTEKRLRLEHIKWYENGGTYNPQSLNIDLTNTFDSRNGKPLCFAQNKFKYKKENMPQRYEYRWADRVSSVFEGRPIRVLSPHVESGLIEQRQVNKFTTDLNYTIANQNISLDGFFLMAATLNVDEYDLNIKALELKTGVFIDAQNGMLANQFLLPAYHGYGMPAEDIEINGIATTANSVTRNKQQPIEFAYEGLSIDPLKLVKTDLGSGQIESLSLNLVNNKYKGVINHDTE